MRIMISLTPAYSPIPATTAEDSSSSSSSSPPPDNNKFPFDFSPPLIAMVVVVAAAFLAVTYARLISRLISRVLSQWKMWRRRRRRRRRIYLPSSNGDLDSPRFYPSPFHHPIDSFHVYSPYGLDDSVIKTIPLSIFTANSKTMSATKLSQEAKDCAVCLLEFEENDYVRTLPGCSHSFHVDCIDIWLRSHANCPLCRAGIFPAESPFVPIMAARIRPSFDDNSFLYNLNMSLESLPEIEIPVATTPTMVTAPEITLCNEESAVNSNIDNCNSEERFNGRDFLLKRSYSFGFERSLGSERMVTEAVTASPWRYRRGSLFWSKRPSPFGSLTKSRVFSFRHYRGLKSPFSRRRGFFPLSESSVRFSVSSRRSKSMTSPLFPRSSTSASAATMTPFFSSSRLRCGDPEALLSPERFTRR